MLKTQHTVFTGTGYLTPYWCVETDRVIEQLCVFLFPPCFNLPDTQTAFTNWRKDGGASLQICSELDTAAVDNC